MKYTPDLIGELVRIREEAKRAREAIATGQAKNGTSALARIEKRAEDAVRWGAYDEQGAPQT